jgi:excisionase family DNA binding protein
MTETEAETWPTIAVVARALDVSPARVYQLIQEGHLRGIRTGLGWLVEPTSATRLQAKRAARKEQARA